MKNNALQHRLKKMTQFLLEPTTHRELAKQESFADKVINLNKSN